MLKINRKLSTYISLTLTVLCFAGLVFMAFYLPTFTNYLIQLPDNTGERLSLTTLDTVLIHVAAYVILALAFTGDTLLFFLLLEVLKGKVFTGKAVALIRGISWCLMLIGGVFILLTYYFTLSVYVGFAVIFFGVSVRVVKNVIEQAVHIKEENDFTI